MSEPRLRNNSPWNGQYGCLQINHQERRVQISNLVSMAGTASASGMHSSVTGEASWKTLTLQKNSRKRQLRVARSVLEPTTAEQVAPSNDGLRWVMGSVQVMSITPAGRGQWTWCSERDECEARWAATDVLDGPRVSLRSLSRRDDGVGYERWTQE